VTFNVEFINFGMFGNCAKFLSLNQHFKLETMFFWQKFYLKVSSFKVLLVAFGRCLVTLLPKSDMMLTVPMRENEP